MAIHSYQHSAAARFMRYVQIDTQSDPDSPTQPSTEKQKDLLRLLVRELHEIGLADAEMDANGYVYATIPATSGKENVPVLCFCSHVDTAGDCSGTDVKPLLHKNWQGEDIVLPDDPKVVISKNDHPYLQNKIGHDIITASGHTLLGADNKSGVAILMDLAAYLTTHPHIAHGKIRLLFTPDEEIGRGVAAVDMARVGADFGYTLDDGDLGSLEWESFSADAMDVTFYGVSTHPGAGKDKLVHAIKVAAHFVASLPKELSPEATSGREGFVHPTDMRGELEQATVKMLLRDFDTAKLVEYTDLLNDLATQAVAAYPGSRFDSHVRAQYRNMGEVIRDVPQVVDNAREAFARVGVEAFGHGIRGGTDGSNLSFMGLPCPNLFTGQMAIHSRQEYISVQDMEKSVEMLVALVQVWEEKA